MKDILLIALAAMLGEWFDVDRLRALGNGQVPAVAGLAWQTLTKERTQ